MNRTLWAGTVLSVLAAAAGCASGPRDGGNVPRMMAADQEEEKGKEKPAAKSPAEAQKEAIGGCAGASIYLAFVLVGVTADAFEKGVYDAERVQAIMSEIKALGGVMKKQLKAIRGPALGKDDEQAVDNILLTLASLDDYADRLDQYTRKKGKEEADAFQEARKKTWEKVRTLLGIK